MRRAAIILLILSVAPAVPAAGAETTVQARVDAARIGEGDSLNLTIEVKGRASGYVEEPDLSGLADFTIVAGPSVSTSTSMVWRGGQATSSTSRQYSYVLMPRRRGTLTIPTISVRINRKNYRTDPISVEVVEGRLHDKSSRGTRLPLGGGPDRRPETEGEIFVESEVDKSEVYVGEQILVTYRVFTQRELADLPSPQALPAYTGFWVEEIPVDPRATIRRVTRDGELYHEFIVMKKALFPTTSGRLRIASTAFGLPVKMRGRDPFDAIFFTPTRMVYRKTDPIVINVKPLPRKGRPDSFNGAVGNYSLTVMADRHETRVNEAIGLKVVVKGTGNIRVVGEAKMPPLADYRSYEPKVEEKRRIKNDTLTGRKTWDYVLTPLAPGVQDIPPIRFSYFDPARGVYVEKRSAPIRVRVAKAASPLPGTSPGMRREVTAVGKDIHYIKTAILLGSSRTPYHRSKTFAVILLSPLLLNAGLLLAVRRRRHLAANSGMVRRKKAPRFARRRLRRARELFKAQDSRPFYEEVGRAIQGYLGDKLNHSPSGLTHELIENLLQQRGVERELREEVLRCLDVCDYARFAPAEPDPAAKNRLVEDSEQIIARLEKQIG
ncbi:MAG: BatD family protein [Acidobacteriota bacterium]